MKRAPTRKLFRLHGDARLEQALRHAVKGGLAHEKKQEPDLAHLWIRALKQRPREMSRSQFMELKVLYRQFEEKNALGLPAVVWAARLVVRKVRQIRGSSSR